MISAGHNCLHSWKLLSSLCILCSPQQTAQTAEPLHTLSSVLHHTQRASDHWLEHHMLSAVAVSLPHVGNCLCVCIKCQLWPRLYHTLALRASATRCQLSLSVSHVVSCLCLYHILSAACACITRCQLFVPVLHTVRFMCLNHTLSAVCDCSTNY